MKPRQIFLVVFISSASSFGSMALYHTFKKEKQITADAFPAQQPVHYAGYVPGEGMENGAADFTKAVAASVPAVVHIKTKTAARRVTSNEPIQDAFTQLFGQGYGSPMVPEQKASGSGVVISSDGYIVTNEHVLADASGNLVDEISVTLANGKNYKAKLVGRESATDVALLKIEATDLRYLPLGNPSDLQTGQWVLAVGYPLSLQTTVTAGIISGTGTRPAAPGKQAGNRQRGERHYIQTDAAVNTGSSGGALMNLEGELVGITNGIVSPNGTYAGYSFAIPVTEVRKAIRTIIQASGSVKEN